MGFIYIGTWIALYGFHTYWSLISSTSNMPKPFSDQIVSILVTIEGELVCILGFTTVL